MYRQFNIQQFYVLPAQCIYVFCVDLRTNSDYFTVQHWLVGFYNWDGGCLLRGTDLSVYNSGLFLSSNGQLRHTSIILSSPQFTYHIIYSYVNCTETDRSLSHCAIKCCRQAAVCFCDFPIFVTVNWTSRPESVPKAAISDWLSILPSLRNIYI
jgi:hypothetical protein